MRAPDPVDAADDQDTPGLSEARKKLERRLDEMYWPGYSAWSSAERQSSQAVRSAEGDSTPRDDDGRHPADNRTNATTTADVTLSSASKSADVRREPEDPLALDPPNRRTEVPQDDTLARLQHRSTSREEPLGSTQRTDSPTTTTPDHTSGPAYRSDSGDEPARNTPPLEDRSESTPRLTSEAADQPGTDTYQVMESPAPDADQAEPHAPDLRRAAAMGGNSMLERDTGNASPPEVGHEFVRDAKPHAMDQYRRIREADDLDALAANSGFSREVIEEAKQNLFQRQHDVAVGPGDVRHGYFMPNPTFGDLWEKVASDAELTDSNRVEFWSLLAHEYVESKLMAAGLPYLSSEPDAWDADGTSEVSPEFPSAHNTAPLSAQSTMKDLLRLWDNVLKLPRGGLRVAEDLSNLDEVVRVAKEGLGL